MKSQIAKIQRYFTECSFKRDTPQSNKVILIFFYIIIIKYSQSNHLNLLIVVLLIMMQINLKVRMIQYPKIKIIH